MGVPPMQTIIEFERRPHGQDAHATGIPILSDEISYAPL